MIRWKPMALAALAAALIAEPALAVETAKAQRPACFWSRDVRGWSSTPDSRTVYLRVRTKDVYRLDLLGPCPDIDFSMTLGLDSRGSSSVCSALDATIVSKGPTGLQRCSVKTLTKLTPAEAEALPRKQRP